MVSVSPVQLLYFEGCPGFEQLAPRLRELVGGRDDVELIAIDTAEAADRFRFLGSPTVRVDGMDVEPGADSRTDFGMKCRLYPGAAGPSHVPSDEWILEALRARS